MPSEALASDNVVRFAVDTGGTFTDLVVEDESGRFRLYKAATVAEDPVRGVLDVLELAARELELRRDKLLSRARLFVHGTTRAINAILTGTTARTAFLTTKGHPDILLYREGGRTDLFNWTRPYPEPYLPRRLTYEIPERVGADGAVVRQLNEQAVIEIVHALEEEQVEAVAVCLLWSIVNPSHELRVGELLDKHLPGVPYTLSHLVNPTIREYRRASAAAIDASLKPLMSEYLRSLESRLREAGLSPEARVLIVTSGGGMLDAADISETPIHSIGSGPAMAPVASRRYARIDVEAETAIVADAGGTSYDVSLVRRGRIPFTRETWLGAPYLGDMTGFPSIDVRSVGAGGGSLARVDEGGLLHVGPQSAGASPGPACYGLGGSLPTVTDAALVLGYLDSDYFLGGEMKLDVDAAKLALEREVAARLGLGLKDAAAAVLTVVTENMARTIEELTIRQGIDPRAAVMVGGGGAAGLNAVAIARRLGCRVVIIPEVAAALSATGALMSELTGEYAATFPTTSDAFDLDGVNATLDGLLERCQQFVDGPGQDSLESKTECSVEARYPHQTWEIEVPLRNNRYASRRDVEDLREDFHSTHEEIFAVTDPDSSIELLTWHARVSCRLQDVAVQRVATVAARSSRTGAGAERAVCFPDVGVVKAAVRSVDEIVPGERLVGPAIIESPATTVVVDPGASVELRTTGSLVISPREGDEPPGVPIPVHGDTDGEAS